MKSSEQIKREYKKVLLQVKCASALFILLIAPSFILNIINETLLFNINEMTWDYVAIFGGVLYLTFYKFFWKCPNCGSFPGGGWYRLNCKSCGVTL